MSYADVVTPGKNYVFYCDQYGNIVYHETKATLNTGYLLKVAPSGSGINTAVSAHIYATDGKLIEYNLNDNVKIETINGRKSYSSSRVKDALVDYANEIYGTGINPDARFFVQYGLTDNKISSIMLPYVIKTKDEYNNPPSNYAFFKLDYLLAEFKTSGVHIKATENTKEYYRLSYVPSNSSFGFAMTTAASCSIFYVPEFSNSSYNDSNFAIQDVNKLSKESSIAYYPEFDGSNNQVELYSTNREVRLVDNIVWIKTNGHATQLENTAEDNAIVTKVSGVISEDGDPLVKISVMENKTHYDLFSDNPNVVLRSTFEDTALVGSASNNPLILPTLHSDKQSIVPGDIIRYSKNADGYVNDIALMYDSEHDMISYRDVKSFTGSTVKYRHTCGEVVDIYGNYALIEVYDTDLSTKTKEAHKVSSFFRVYVYDYKDKMARTGTGADVSIGDKVYFSMWYSSSKDGEIVIYKGKGEGR